MSNRPQFGRRVPAEEKAAHEERAAEIGREAGRVAEDDLVAYLPTTYIPEPLQDGMHDLGDRVQALREHLGLPGQDFSPKDSAGDEDVQNGPGAHSWSDDRDVCNWRIDERLRTAVEAFARDTYGKTRGKMGEVLAAATRAARQEPEPDRLVRHLDEICDATDGLPDAGELDTDMSRRVQATIDHLAEQDAYHRLVIEDAVTDEQGGDVSGDPEPYVERVVDRLGLVDSPTADEPGVVFMTPERAEDVREGVLAGVEDLTRAMYDGMDPEEKVEYLQARLVAKAENHRNGLGYATYSDVRDRMFNGFPSNSHTYTLMEKAASDTEAFRYGDHRGEKGIETRTAWHTPDDPAEAFAEVREQAIEETVGQYLNDEERPDLNRTLRTLAHVSPDVVEREHIPEAAVDEVRERVREARRDPEAIEQAFGTDREETLDAATEWAAEYLGDYGTDAYTEENLRVGLLHSTPDGVSTTDDVPADAVEALRERLTDDAEQEPTPATDGAGSEPFAPGAEHVATDGGRDVPSEDDGGEA